MTEEGLLIQYCFKIFLSRLFLKSLLNLLQYCFCFMSWLLGPEACGIIAHQVRIELTLPALKRKALTTGPPGKSPNAILMEPMEMGPAVDSTVSTKTSCPLGTSKCELRDFPGGPVIMNSSCNAGDVGSIPDRETKIPHAAEHLLKSAGA